MSSSSTTRPTEIPTRSRRSSTAQSVRSLYRQPAWRSSSLAKSTAPVAASVSIIFAEPEQGAPLASASSSVNVALSPPTLEELEESTSTLKPMSNAADRQEPRNEEKSTETLAGASISASPSDHVFHSPSPSTSRSLSLNAKVSLPNLTTSTVPRSRKNSWFSSITRSKGKSVMRRDSEVQQSTHAPYLSLPETGRPPTSAISTPADATVHLEPASALEPLPLSPNSEQEPVVDDPQPSRVIDGLPTSSEPAVSALVSASTPSSAAPFPPPNPPTAAPTPVAPTAQGSSIPIPLPVTPNRQTTPLGSAGKRSWFSSATSSPVSSPPAPRYMATVPGVYCAELPSPTLRPTLLEAPLQTSPESSPTRNTYADSRGGTSTAAPAPSTLVRAQSNAPSLPSSIDDRVPSLPPTPPAYALTPPFSSAQANSPTLQSPPLSTTSSLNPSSSRFTLSLPLLGRAKVPLGSVLGLGGNVDSKGVKSEEGRTRENQDDPSTANSSMASDIVRPADQDAPQAHSSSNLVGGQRGLSTSSTPDPSLTERSAASADAAETSLFVVHSTTAVSPSASSLSSASTLPASEKHEHNGSSSWWDYVGWSNSDINLTTQNNAKSWKNEGGAKATVASASAPALVESSQAAVQDMESGEVHDAFSDEHTREANTEPLPVASASSADSALQEAVPTYSNVMVEDPASSPGMEVVDGGGSTLERNSQGNYSNWLAPWSWYPSSSSANTISASRGTTDAQPSTQSDPSEHAEKEGIASTELEGSDQMPCEEAKAASDITAPSSVSPYHKPDNQPTKPPLAESINPIASTFQTSTSSWASISRTWFVKSLGYDVRAGAIEDVPARQVKTDENGVEIMELDEDEDELEGHKDDTRGRSSEAKDIGGEIDNSNSTATAHINPCTDADAQAKENKQEAERQRKHPVALPLTISEDVKKETELANVKLRANGGRSGTATPKIGTSGTNTPAIPASPSTSSFTGVTSESKGHKSKTSTTKTVITSSNTRTSSPTPSKKSISGSNPAPPPPNLVLPTWQDTFHTAPRNVLPPKPEAYVDDQGVGGSGTGGSGGGKLLGRMGKFVSGVLFSSGPSTSESGGGAGVGSAGDLRGVSQKGKERARDVSVVSSRSRYNGAGGQGSEVSGSSISMAEKQRQEQFREFGKELPKAWTIFEEAGWDTNIRVLGGGCFNSKPSPPTLLRALSGRGTRSAPSGTPKGMASPGLGGVRDVLRGCKRIVVIGVHGWFPGAMIRSVLGEPTGTSTKFANMMEQAIQDFESEHGVKLEKITKIPLEGEGQISKRVEKLYMNLKANADWMADLHAADAIIVATHSQGSVVSTHLLDQLIKDNHIVTARNVNTASMAGVGLGLSVGSGVEVSSPAVSEGGRRKIQRLCCLALCGIHLGPLRYLSSSTLVGPYIQYFESTAARELFEFQDTESKVSKSYVQALQNVLNHGTKMLYVASLNDQVVPIYSGLFTAVSHPLILRALYIDGDAYHSSDFLSNLLVLLLRILNSGISDSGLLAHLSEATAGSLNGVGHSTAYEELATYSLAVKYLFLTNEGDLENPQLVLEPFNANHEQNDYEIPWSLRDIIADPRVSNYFSNEITQLRDAFKEWHPKTSILRDLKRKLQPITRLPREFGTVGNGTIDSTTASKL